MTRRKLPILTLPFSHSLTALILVALLLLPAAANAQGNDWEFTAPVLTLDEQPYGELRMIVYGWAPPLLVGGDSIHVGWHVVDGTSDYDAALATFVDGSNTYHVTLYVRHGLFATSNELRYFLSSSLDYTWGDINIVAMAPNVLTANPADLEFDYHDDALTNVGIDEPAGGIKIEFKGTSAACDPNLRYWELGFPTLTFGGETYRIGWFSSEFGSSEFFFGRPHTMDLDDLDPADDINLALVDFCQEDDCESMDAEIFRVALFWAAGEFANQGALETMLAGELYPDFEDFEVALFDTDPVFEAPGDYDDFTFLGWPTGVSGGSAHLDFIGSVIDVHVFDPSDATDVENATCAMVNRNSGEFLMPYVLSEYIDDGIHRLVVPELPLRPDDNPSWEFALGCVKPTDYLPVYNYQLPAPAPTTLEYPLISVELLIDLLTELEYTSLIENPGFVYGFAFWNGPSGWEPVGCATAEATGVDPDDIHYSDPNTGWPSLTQSSTDPGDPSFLMVNVPETDTGMTLTVTAGTETAERWIPKIDAFSMTLSFVLFDGEENPDACE